ncbi:hypothetical protein ACIBL8_30535 [Streptomyces sp. NPDC050523]|uniref:hypothetical protein n=1 Tax=Streptomyces sp. NPDC050523 TaxID=3365622 RepID=UPI0037B15F46
MWPGQQQPGGGQEPQQQPAQGNPYRQPGYQQPNPYAGQPTSHGEPQTPYGEPQTPYGGRPTPYGGQPPTGGGPSGPPGGGRRTKVIAVTAAAAVVAAAAVTGAVLLGGGSDDKVGPDPAPSSASPTATADPRAAGKQKPTVAGWQVVVNADAGIAFDVPANWVLQSPGWVSYVAENDDPDDKPLVAMKAPALLKEKWCASDDDKDGKVDYTPLASVGTRKNNGARSTAQAARSDSAAWVYGTYTQPDHKKVATGPAAPFTTASGLTGSVATSRSSGVTKRHKCDSDGKATTFAFKNADGDFASWSFVGAKGVGEEVPDSTVRKILGTVRLYTPPGES